MTDEKPKASSFAEVLKASRQVTPIDGLDEWGLTLFMRPISEQESASHEASLWKDGTTELDPNRLKLARARLIALVVADENGKPVMTCSQVTAIDSRLSEFLYDKCKEFVKAPVIGKNSKPASDAGSPSDSQPSADATT